RMSGSVVGAERIVAKRARRDVHRDAVVWRQLIAFSNDFHHVAAKGGITNAVKVRRWAWINPWFCGISAHQSKWSHAKPLCAEIVLDWAGDGKTVLVHCVYDIKALPPIDITRA